MPNPLSLILVLLVYLAGFVLAVVYWQRYPRPSLMVAISSMVLFPLSVAGELRWHEGLFYGALRWSLIILLPAALSLLLAAVFAGRRTAPAAGEEALQGAQRVFLPRYAGSVARGLLLGLALLLLANAIVDHWLTTENLLWLIPVLLVYPAGFVLAMVYWQRYPRPSLMVAISSMVLFKVQGPWRYGALESGQIILLLPALILLLAAVFAGRRTAPAAGEEALQGAQRVFLPRYAGSVAGGLLLGLPLLLLAGAVVVWGHYPFVHAAVDSLGFLAMVAVLLCLWAAIIYVILVAAGERVIQGAQRVSPTFYVGSVAGGLLLGIPLLLLPVAAAVVVGPRLFSGGPLGPAISDGLVTFAALAGVASLLFLWAHIIYVILVYKAWACIQDGFARTTPGKAVGYLFIPIYSYYWVFRAIPGFADEYNAYLRRANISAPPLGRGLLQAQVILQVLVVIPVLWLAAVPIQCIVVAKICAAINALPVTVPSPRPM